jgi:serine/threonine-protein kinase
MTAITDRLNVALTGRYEIERELGAGGMATVFLAEDLKHKRKVALKVLKPELAAVLGAERFVVEIKTTAALQHPHILPLFDSGTADSFLFYVMPFIEGETLRDKLNRETQLGVEEAVRIAREVLDALQYAHEHGIVHRDVKPENILLHGGHAMVADFGIALAVSAAAGGRMTETGLSLGTPHYMSPEQATAEKEITARSDVYSLGSVLYEMLTGNPPHVGSSAQQIIMRIITDAPKPVTEIRKSVPPNIAAAVAKSLEKLPADRFESAKAFGEALTNESFTLATDSAHRTAHAALSWRDRARDPLVLALGALAVALGVTVAMLVRREPADAPTVRFFVVPTAAHHFTYNVPGFALSPDGQAIVYRDLAPDATPQLYVRHLGVVDAQPLVGTLRGAFPFFSADGRWIGFTVAGGKVMKVALDGGSPLPIGEGSSQFGADWLPSDNIVLGSGAGGLTIVPAAGGAARLLISLDSAHGETAQSFPRVLDDGKTILFVSVRADGSSRIGVTTAAGAREKIFDLVGGSPLGVIDGRLIYASLAGALLAVPVDAKNARTTGAPMPLIDGVVVGENGAANAALSRSGSLVYSAGTELGRVVLADESGGAPRPVIDNLRVYWGPRFSPDGKRIAVALGTHGKTDVWMYDLASRTLERVTSEGTNDSPEWSPDGKSLLFYSRRAGEGSLWRQPANGNGAAQLVVPHASEGVFTPDGHGIVFSRNLKVWYRSDGDTTPKPVAVAAATQVAARVSPDGRWVAYSSDESGTAQVYVRPLPALNSRYQVSAEGGVSPVWSHDGRRLYYEVGYRVLIAATIATTPDFSVARRDTVSRNEFVPYTPHANYDAAPDGSHVLLVAPNASPQWQVVINWRTEVRRRFGGK